MKIEQQNNLENFTIYRDGEIDRWYQSKQMAERVLRGIGSLAYQALETTVDALDEWVASAQ